MAKLDIIIPHYKEPAELMDPMFGILKLQRNINWTDFRVVIINDGEDIVLPDGFGSDMPFDVVQFTVPHGGISAARNAGIDRSTADWIMFCDSDDAFSCTTSLQSYFKYADVEKKALVTSAFMEESPGRDGKMHLHWHDGKDYIFIHGKMWNRKWLIENHIRFHDSIQLHEDSYFVAMARYLLSGNDITHIRDCLYLWQWNPASVTRRCKNFVLETYDKLCIKNSAMVDEMLRRGMYVPAKGIVCRTITDAYASLHRISWNTRENADLIQDAEDCVALFLQRYDYIFKGAGETVIQVGLDSYVNRMKKIGDFPEEVISFEDWLAKLRKPSMNK